MHANIDATHFRCVFPSAAPHHPCVAFVWCQLRRPDHHDLVPIASAELLPDLLRFATAPPFFLLSGYATLRAISRCSTICLKVNFPNLSF